MGQVQPTAVAAEVSEVVTVPPLPEGPRDKQKPTWRSLNFGPRFWFSVILILALAAVGGNVIQHRLVWSGESLIPKFSKISPMGGAKRLFSKQALANFIKGLIKLALVGSVLTALMWPERDRLDGLISSSWIFSRARFLEVACLDLEALAEKRWMNSCSSLIFSSFFLLASFI